jgi:hypothetical protein
LLGAADLVDAQHFFVALPAPVFLVLFLLESLLLGDVLEVWPLKNISLLYGVSRLTLD